MASLSLPAFRRGLKVALAHDRESASRSARSAAGEKKVARPDALLVAQHEMGHIVAAYLVGAKVGAASVVPLGLLAGESTVHLVEAEGVLPLEHETVVALAGLVAERAVSGRLSWRGASRDLARAFDLACDQLVAAPGSNARVATEFLWKRYGAVSNLLGEPENAAAIRSLADLLVVKKTLSARQIRALLRQRGLRKVHVQTLGVPSAGTPVHGAALNRLNRGLSLEEAMIQDLLGRVARGELPAAGTKNAGMFRYSWRTDVAGRVRVVVKEIAAGGDATS